MVDDHGNANQELIALAQTKNINIPEIWSNKSQDKTMICPHHLSYKYYLFFNNICSGQGKKIMDRNFSAVDRLPFF